MTHADLDYFYSLTNEYRSIRYDLRNMRILAEALGNPQDSFRSVLVAGTNGKGSVAALLAGMIDGCGLYTSPHLERLNERIRIGGAPVSDDDLGAVFSRVRAAAEEPRGYLYPPTYFEIVTAMALTHFASRVTRAVLEVGLGGRLDATNIVRQDVSVITSIGYDHQEFLGSTIGEIAAEKAGIIKGDEPVVVGGSAMQPVVVNQAGNRLAGIGDSRVHARPLGLGYFAIDIETPVRSYPDLRPRLAGRHQIENTCLAIRSAELLADRGWPITQESIANSINTTAWPGRLERFPGEPSFLLDGAHNVPAAAALSRFLAEFYPGGIWLIFGAMADKDYTGMLALLKPHLQRAVFTRAASARAQRPEEFLAVCSDGVCTASVSEAIDFARTRAPRDATVLICGSLYLVGEARPMLHSARSLATDH